ncbi:nucleotide sugar dehydrogenase, partial [Candidatus Dojkabacteria bacterium]|nr:nucleotide sugar dehydrogenase [Candidatus Dojkabacteria bacterium]
MDDKHLMNSKVVKKKIAVIGLGYVGLPLACAIAKSKKYSVVGFDIDEEKTSQISNRICPIDDEICARDLKEVVLDVSSDIEIIKESDYFILCVPTPV